MMQPRRAVLEFKLRHQHPIESESDGQVSWYHANRPLLSLYPATSTYVVLEKLVGF
jgi:hypothetical protein